jgi:hypothetical protein
MSVQVNLPYEGITIFDFPSVEDVLNFINKSNYSLDDIDLVETKHLDVYNLIKNCRGGK